MPRFFFDFRQAGDCIPDPEGMEFANVEEAYLEAFNGAQEMWSTLLKQRSDPRRCRFEVSDASHNMLFVFPFQEVLECCQGRDPVALKSTLDRAHVTAGYAKRAGKAFNDELDSMRNTLRQSQALLNSKS
jgi:hypothetical protein